MRIFKIFVASIIAVFSCSLHSVNAAVIDYTANHLGGTQWRYDYAVTNDSPVGSISEITIFFDPTRYVNLQDVSTAADWDPLVIQPDTGIPAPGFLDVLAIGAGIAASGTQAGFSVVFDFLAPGTPGSQAFNIVDPATFAILDAGFTQPAGSAAQLPAPSTNLLILLGGIALLWSRQRQDAVSLTSQFFKTFA